MSLPQRNKKRYSIRYRLKRKPLVSFLGFVGEMTTQVKYSESPPQMLQVGFGVQDLTGTLIEIVGKQKTLYLIASFLDYIEDNTYRAYQVTDYLNLSREESRIHPVTKQKIIDQTVNDKIWVHIEPVDGKPDGTINPIQRFNIRSDTELRERDVIGNYLVRMVYKENGLWVGQCEFKEAKGV